MLCCCFSPEVLLADVTGMVNNTDMSRHSNIHYSCPYIHRHSSMHYSRRRFPKLQIGRHVHFNGPSNSCSQTKNKAPIGTLRITMKMECSLVSVVLFWYCTRTRFRVYTYTYTEQSLKLEISEGRGQGQNTQDLHQNW